MRRSVLGLALVAFALSCLLATAEQASARGRTVVILVDEENMRAGYGKWAGDAAVRFVDRMNPDDHVGVLIPRSRIRVAPTTDHAAVKAGLSRVVGHMAHFTGRPTAEACDSMYGPLTPPVQRPGAQPAPPPFDGDAKGVVDDMRDRAINTFRSLVLLFDSLSTQPGPNGRRLLASGILDGPLARLALEISGQYFLGVRTEPKDRDGKPHRIRVTVKRNGVDVRARQTFAYISAGQSESSASPSAAPDAAAPSRPPTTPPPSRAPASPASSEAGAQSVPTPREARLTAGQTSTPPDLETLLARARGYLDEYVQQLSLVIGVERYTQWVTTSGLGASFSQGGDRPSVRNTVSEFALVRVKDDWLGYRDVVEVDGKPVRDRQDRLQQLFLHNADAARDQARKIADESARYNAGAMQRNFNVPTMALYFLQPAYASRFRFTSDGSDTVDGVAACKVRYEETRKPTIIKTSAGANMPVSGMLWIEPASGRILKTFLGIASEVQLGQAEVAEYDSRGRRITRPDLDPGREDKRVPTFAHVTVTYRHDDRLGIFVPGKMDEEYQAVAVASNQERIQRIKCSATYSDFKKFETSGTIIRGPE